MLSISCLYCWQSIRIYINYVASASCYKYWAQNLLTYISDGTSTLRHFLHIAGALIDHCMKIIDFINLLGRVKQMEPTDNKMSLRLNFLKRCLNQQMAL